MNDTFSKVLISLFLLFIVILGIGLNSEKKERDILKKNCIKTDLFVIRYKGGIAPVYDCAPAAKEVEG